MAATVNLRTQGDIAIIELSGYLDYESRELKLPELVMRELESGRRKFLLDFSGVQNTDSTGMGYIAQIWTMVTRYKGIVAGVSPGGQVRNLFKITRLDQAFDIYASLEEAIAAVQNQAVPTS